MAEMNVDMERMMMEREDKLSTDVRFHNHKLKFKDKDLLPPSLPAYLSNEEGIKNPLKIKPS